MTTRNVRLVECDNAVGGCQARIEIPLDAHGLVTEDLPSPWREITAVQEPDRHHQGTGTFTVCGTICAKACFTRWIHNYGNKGTGTDQGSLSRDERLPSPKEPGTPAPRVAKKRKDQNLDKTP